MGNLGAMGDALARLARPGGLDVLGPVENAWLVALGLACVGPLLALVAPRVSRLLALLLVPAAMALASIAAVREQTMLALGLITLAITAAFVASWSTRTLRESIGSFGVGPSPRRRPGGVTMTRAQARSFDYLVARRP